MSDDLRRTILDKITQTLRRTEVWEVIGEWEVRPDQAPMMTITVLHNEDHGYVVEARDDEWVRVKTSNPDHDLNQALIETLHHVKSVRPDGAT